MDYIRRHHVKKSEKGFFVKYPEFMIIDKTQDVENLLEKYDTFEFQIVKVIRDRRNQEVKIIKLIPHYHKFNPKSDDYHICECGKEEPHCWKILKAKELDNIYHVEELECNLCGYKKVERDYHRYQLVEKQEDYVVERCICGRERKIEIFKDVRDFVNKKVKFPKDTVLTIINALKEYSSLKRTVSSLKSELEFLQEKKELLEKVLSEKEITLVPQTSFRVYYLPPDAPGYYLPYTREIQGDEESRITVYFDDEMNPVDVEFWVCIDNDTSFMFEIVPVSGFRELIPRGMNFYDGESGKKITVYEFLTKNIGNISVFWDRHFDEFNTLRELILFLRNIKNNLLRIEEDMEKVREMVSEKQKELEKFVIPESEAYECLVQLFNKYRTNEVFKKAYYERDPYDGYFGGIDISLEEWLDVLIQEGF